MKQYFANAHNSGDVNRLNALLENNAKIAGYGEDIVFEGFGSEIARKQPDRTCLYIINNLFDANNLQNIK